MIFFLKTYRIHFLLFLISGMFLLNTAKGQNLYLKKKIEIEYLALQVNFHDTAFTFYQKRMLQTKIEEAIADHNSEDVKFHIYLVDQIEPGMTGLRMDLDDFYLPDKRSQHTAFIISLFGLIATPVALAAANSSFYLIFWSTTHNFINHDTYLSESLSTRSNTPLKYRIQSNGGWFKKPDVNEESIIEKFDYKFRRLLDKIHTSYRPPKELRGKAAKEFNLPTTFGEEFNAEEIEDIKDSLESVHKPVEVDTSYVKKRAFLSWWSFDFEAGMSFPGAKDINSSLTPMFSMGLGPKFKMGEDFRIKPFYSFDLMIKNHNYNVSVGEVWMNSRFGLQLEYPFYPGASESFSLYPLINIAYATGTYDFVNHNLEDPENGVTTLRHKGLSLGAGFGLSKNWFTCTLYYNYYIPRFKFVDGPPLNRDFDSKLNMSTISLQLGASVW